MAPAIIAAIISGLASIGSTVAAGSKSAKLNNQAASQLEAQKQRNNDWYNVKMNQDYTKRADAQAVIQKQRELLNEQYRNARATNIVAGGSDAQLAAQKQLANDSLAKTMSDIAANGANAKDNAEQQYLQTDANLTAQQIAALQGRGNSVAQAGSQAGAAGLNLAGSLLNYEINKKNV